MLLSRWGIGVSLLCLYVFYTFQIEIEQTRRLVSIFIATVKCCHVVILAQTAQLQVLPIHLLRMCSLHILNV